MDQELTKLQKEARTLTKEELDRDFAELCNDLRFLESQVQADLGSYDPEGLSFAYAKISRLKPKLKILKVELARRG
jgi:hypothetical protein